MLTNSSILYPLLFNPIYKQRIWGGTKLNTFLNKNIPATNIGESWEIADLPNNHNTVANGFLKGKSFKEIISTYKNDILGDKVVNEFGLTFPLLFKFLDAKEDLSIQLHPNDQLAKLRHNSFGKTEMWYIMQADEDAEIIVGFKQNICASQFLTHLQNKTLPTILKKIKVKPGEVYFLETGTIHAIGKGIVIAEIQQTSDITYRVYDWDRVDAQGNLRELHIDLALEAINYNYLDTKCCYAKQQNKANTIVKSKYFTTNYIPLSGEVTINKTKDCFRVYVITTGEVNFCIANECYTFKMGDTVLIPANLTEYKIKGQAEMLEIYIEY